MVFLKGTFSSRSFFLDGERVAVVVKDMGSCEIYPQTLLHNSNGRYIVACGDGEYIVYTATALRNKVLLFFTSPLNCSVQKH